MSAIYFKISIIYRVYNINLITSVKIYKLEIKIITCYMYEIGLMKY